MISSGHRSVSILGLPGSAEAGQLWLVWAVTFLWRQVGGRSRKDRRRGVKHLVAFRTKRGAHCDRVQGERGGDSLWELSNCPSERRRKFVLLKTFWDESGSGREIGASHGGGYPIHHLSGKGMPRPSTPPGGRVSTRRNEKATTTSCVSPRLFNKCGPGTRRRTRRMFGREVRFRSLSSTMCDFVVDCAVGPLTRVNKRGGDAASFANPFRRG
jgi:hypothetical protein